MAVMVLKPLVPDRNALRLFQVLGVDFAATLLLAAGLIGKCLRKPGAKPVSVISNELSLRLDPCAPSNSEAAASRGCATSGVRSIYG
jgi:hypothetical protein